MIQYTVDRFEEDTAVLENRETGEIINVSRKELPKEIKEGDILKYINDSYEIDFEETENVKNTIREMFNNLMKK